MSTVPPLEEMNKVIHDKGHIMESNLPIPRLRIGDVTRLMEHLGSSTAKSSTKISSCPLRPKMISPRTFHSIAVIVSSLSYRNLVSRPRSTCLRPLRPHPVPTLRSGLRVSGKHIVLRSQELRSFSPSFGTNRLQRRSLCAQNGITKAQAFVTASDRNTENDTYPSYFAASRNTYVLQN